MSGVIVLSGFMATGKSTVGRALASHLGVPFVDTDERIEDATGRSVADVWRAEGERSFRERERAIALELLGDGAAKVIAFGGGTVTIDDVRRTAVEKAFVVTLTAPPSVIVGRAGDAATRPNLTPATPGGGPLGRAAELLSQRRAAYAEAHLTLSTDGVSIDELAVTIATAARRAPLLVPLGERSYTVDFVVDEPTRVTDALSALAPSSTIVVTDSNVQRNRGESMAASLRGIVAPNTWVTLPPGEEHKALATVSTIWDAALGAGVDRDAVIVAFGGGVVGDLAGFAASTLLRGVRFIQVPTTVLSMVDSSVGGKTGFDHAAGKNLIGSFHQPSSVVVDLDHLKTLPSRHRVAGLAEIVKVALACDARLFEALEANAEAIASGHTDAIAPIVRASVAAKARIVAADEREAGVRAVLNLGHTIGHALESHGNYATLLHGEAVALGLVAELDATSAFGWTPGAVVHRVKALLERVGLPTVFRADNVRSAWAFVESDKKRAGVSLNLPVTTGIGAFSMEKVPVARLRDHFH